MGTSVSDVMFMWNYWGLAVFGVVVAAIYFKETALSFQSFPAWSSLPVIIRLPLMAGGAALAGALLGTLRRPYYDSKKRMMLKEFEKEIEKQHPGYKEKRDKGDIEPENR